MVPTGEPSSTGRPLSRMTGCRLAGTWRCGSCSSLASWLQLIRACSCGLQRGCPGRACRRWVASATNAWSRCREVSPSKARWLGWVPASSWSSSVRAATMSGPITSTMRRLQASKASIVAAAMRGVVFSAAAGRDEAAASRTGGVPPHGLWVFRRQCEGRRSRYSQTVRTAIKRWLLWWVLASRRSTCWR